MLLRSLLVGFVITSVVTAARNPLHAGREAAERVLSSSQSYDRPARGPHVEEKRYLPPLIPQNANTSKFVVDGTKIPDVDFDIGESYAGLMPINSVPGTKEKLYFWFFPSSNPNATNDLTIWLNGGPGCSSLEGFLQENGPFLHQYGTFRPVKNPWTWVNLTNMLWVEQPGMNVPWHGSMGTGFSQGRSTETSQAAVAKSFLGFMKNFEDTFNFTKKKIYITGESYAGMYVPYIADAMFNANDKTYFDVHGTMIYDPSVNSDTVLAEIPAVPLVKAFDKLFNLNDTFTAELKTRHQNCGYADFMDKYLVYPPVPGKMPVPPRPNTKACSIWRDIKEAVTKVNPCFNIYDIATTCPLLWDVLGFPGSFEYVPKGAEIYFNRTDVQKAINAPLQPWEECSNVALSLDRSPYSGLSVLPSVIERSKRTIIAHGNLDFILIANGTLMTIQNMTWGGKQGFQTKPNREFYVPYHRELNQGTLAGSGVMGVTHTERGLTWVEVFLSGHMIPQYQPSVAYRQMEFLLGRIDSLTEVSPFTTQQDVSQFGGVRSGNASVPVAALF